MLFLVESTETGPFDRYADHSQILAHYRHVLTTRLAGLVDSLTTSNSSSAENGNYQVKKFYRLIKHYLEDSIKRYF